MTVVYNPLIRPHFLGGDGILGGGPLKFPWCFQQGSQVTYSQTFSYILNQRQQGRKMLFRRQRLLKGDVNVCSVMCIYINILRTYMFLHFPIHHPTWCILLQNVHYEHPFFQKKNDPGIRLFIPLNFTMLVSWELLDTLIVWNPPRGFISCLPRFLQKALPFSHLHFFGDLCQGVFPQTVW